MINLSRHPWAITEQSLKTIIAIASRDEFFSEVRKQALEARDGKPLRNTRLATTRDGVAIIPCNGPMFRHGDIMTDISGATTYDALRKDFQAALDDPAIVAILFNIDSPGGEVNGCFELVDAIHAARGTKRIEAYVGGQGTSAAWAIASATSLITAATTAELGSIGVRAGYFDDSEAMAAAGIKQWIFVASQSPKKVFDPNSADDRERFQVVMDDLGQVFVDTAARNRGLTAEDVLEQLGQGDVMVGARAVAAGLADELGNFESVLARLSAGDSSNYLGAARAAKESNMTMKAQTTEPAANVSAGKCDGCGSGMSGGSKSYCAKCYAEDDEDDDEEEASALGLQKQATRAERLTRAAALGSFETQAFTALGATTLKEALEKIGAGQQAVADVASVRAEGQKLQLRAMLEGALDKKTLSLGAVQKSMAVSLRGEQKAAWVKAMGAIKSVTRESVIEAALSVPLAKDDVEAIGLFVSEGRAIAATPLEEPERSAETEGKELDETSRRIDAAVKKTNSTLDRGKRGAAAKK